MSEKLDGIRGYWNGHTLYSRHGNKIKHPSIFTQDLPNIALDGEIWLGYGKFETLMSIFNSSKKEREYEIEWDDMKYMIFDLPDSKEPLEVRMTELKNLHLKSNRHMIVPRQQCQDLQHLNHYMETILSLGGEGVILNQPKSKYISGRTDTVLKVKVN